MAGSSLRLITALRETATRLRRNEVTYRWASFAHCNCGHLAQTISGLSPDEIQRRAMRREGDWGSQAKHVAAHGFPSFDFGDRPALDEGAWEPEDVGACPSTGAPLDEVLAHMYALGLGPADVGHLERLSDPAVRRRLGNNTDYFAHHRRENVIAYLEAWADLLEDELAVSIAPDADVWLEAAE
jgi:hypothetical protein